MWPLKVACATRCRSHSPACDGTVGGPQQSAYGIRGQDASGDLIGATALAPACIGALGMGTRPLWAASSLPFRPAPGHAQCTYLWLIWGPSGDFSFALVDSIRKIPSISFHFRDCTELKMSAFTCTRSTGLPPGCSCHDMAFLQAPVFSLALHRVLSLLNYSDDLGRRPRDTSGAGRRHGDILSTVEVDDRPHED